MDDPAMPQLAADNARSLPHRRGTLAWLDGWLLVGVVVIIALPYLQMYDDSLLCLDDADYLGREVRRGITWQNVRWAFGYHEANWHPLTWLSHMVDWQLAPMHSGWFKFHNLLLHLGSVALFFLFLRRAGEPSVYAALAALVFGVHPLRVSSVAWVAERKDCLCVFFCVATMLAYQAYATRTSWGRYVLVTVLMALAMMAKPLAVSLPIGLLLLDVWPLERTGRRDAAGILALAAEKVPWMLMAGGLAWLTMQAQAAGGAIDEAAPLWFKLQQTVMSYGMYAWQLFVVGGHAVLYPIPAGLQVPTAWVFAVGAGLLGATAVAVNSWRTRPWLFAGWFWFVLVTFPMSGMVTIGEHSHADRYTYLPHLVLLAALARQLRAWGWLEDSRTRVQCVAWAAVVAFCITLAVVTTDWVACWQDSEKVFSRSLEMTGPNEPVLRMLGVYYELLGEPDAALRCFELAVDCDKTAAGSQSLRIRRLARNGRYADAERLWSGLVATDPEAATAVAELLWKWDADDPHAEDRLPFAWEWLRRIAESKGDAPLLHALDERLEREQSGG
jgi:hypothetical protein